MDWTDVIQKQHQTSQSSMSKRLDLQLKSHLERDTEQFPCQVGHCELRKTKHQHFMVSKRSSTPWNGHCHPSPTLNAVNILVEQVDNYFAGDCQNNSAAKQW